MTDSRHTDATATAESLSAQQAVGLFEAATDVLESWLGVVRFELEHSARGVWAAVLSTLLCYAATTVAWIAGSIAAALATVEATGSAWTGAAIVMLLHMGLLLGGAIARRRAVLRISLSESTHGLRSAITTLTQPVERSP